MPDILRRSAAMVSGRAGASVRIYLSLAEMTHAEMLPKQKHQIPGDL